MIRHALFVVAIGCGNGPPEIASDAPPATPCTAWMFQPNEFDPCAIPEGTDEVVLDAFEVSYSIDGDTGEVLLGEADLLLTLPRIAIGDVDVVSLSRLELGRDSSISLVGSRPLVIAAWNDVLLRGGINTTTTPTLGVDGPGCIPAAAGTGCGGGGGGGFAGTGGAGGHAMNGDPGGAGGGARPMPTHLTGGCSGAASSSAAGGRGGGAFAIVARDTLVVDGANLVASGYNSDDRVGGNGSGGMIELEALDLVITNAALEACGVSRNVGSVCPIDGEPGRDAISVEPCGEGGGGGAGHLVYRAHATMMLDTIDAKPSLQPF